MDRRAEIAAKRARLADLRLQRELRAKQRPRADLDIVSAPIDDLISNLTSTTSDDEAASVTSVVLSTAAFSIFDVTPEVEKEAEKQVYRQVYSKAIQTDPIELDDGIDDNEDDNDKPDNHEESEEERDAEQQVEPEKQVVTETRTFTHTLTRSPSLVEFVQKSSKIIARALEDEYDVLKDYTYIKEQPRSDWEININAEFHSPQSAGRYVTALDWSPKFADLFLASYSGSHSKTGLVQVFNLRVHDMPEYKFTAKSEITAARFSPYQPNLIVGACYSGQIVMWDMRSGPEPVLRTPVTSDAHSYPVLSLEFTGTKNASSVISSSTDGRVCVWSTDFLAKPQETFDLKLPPPSRTEDLAATVLGQHSSDSSFVLVGSDDANIYTCNRESRAGVKPGLDLSATYTSHVAPLTGLSFHASTGPLDLSDLFLSCGVDWSIKLWRRGVYEPILEIPCDDAIFDVSWSPARPAVFASVGAGAVDVWDLTADREVPVGSTRLDYSLNKLAWEKSDGSLFAVGGLSDVVSVFEVGSALGGAANAHVDEWKSMRKLSMT